MIFKRILTIAVILLMGGAAGAEQGKGASREQDDCASYARSRAHVGWEDVCYTKDGYPAEDVTPETYTPDRGEVVTNALDAFEKAGSRAQARTDQLMGIAYPDQTDGPRDEFVTYMEAANEEEADNRARREENTEQWLQREYPYVYKDHMEKKASDSKYRSLYDEGQLNFDDGSRSYVPPFLKYIDFGFTVESSRKP